MDRSVVARVGCIGYSRICIHNGYHGGGPVLCGGCGAPTEPQWHADLFRHFCCARAAPAEQDHRVCGIWCGAGICCGDMLFLAYDAGICRRICSEVGSAWAFVNGWGGYVLRIADTAA